MPLTAELRALLVDGAAALGAPLDDDAVARLGTYHDLLRERGAHVNLTARLESREIVVLHFLDSLAGARWIGGGEGGALLDIGTGAGFPGLPLKIAFPAIRAVLLDGTRKKVLFCQEVIRETGLQGVTAEWGRAEELARRPASAGAFRWVTSRAVAKAAGLATLGARFLAPGGSLLLYKGRPDEAELRGLTAACARRGLSFEPHPVVVPGLDGSRTIIVVRRSAP